MARGEINANKSPSCATVLMGNKPITILFSPHAMKRLRQRVPEGHGVTKGSFVRLMLVRQQIGPRKELWVLHAPKAFLLGSVRVNGKGKEMFRVHTVLDIGKVRRQQRIEERQFIPLSVKLFQVKGITAMIPKKEKPTVSETGKRPFAYAVDKTDYVFAIRPTLAGALDAVRARYDSPAFVMGIAAWFSDGTKEEVPYADLCTADKTEWITSEQARQLENRLYGPLPTVREQVTAMLRKNRDSDYWEKLVLRLCEALLAEVDENLRGIPVEEAGLEPLSMEDYENLPEGAIELVDGIPSPKRWTLYGEGRKRLGFASWDEEQDAVMGLSRQEIDEFYKQRRAALRAQPFVPSQEPFAGGIKDVEDEQDSLERMELQMAAEEREEDETDPDDPEASAVPVPVRKPPSDKGGGVALDLPAELTNESQEE